MLYRFQYYIGIFLYVARWWLASMISFQATVAVLLTGVFAVKVLMICGIATNIQNLIFLPCACYFLWAFCISLIDMNIERDAL